MTYADRPIQWREWHAETLAEARRSGRALLLAFHGGWDERPDLAAAAAADPALAHLIAEMTVPVAIDVDVTPEVAARFEADADSVVLASADGRSAERPEPSELRGSLASGPHSPPIDEALAGSSARTELSPSILDIASEAALEVPYALGTEALRLLVYTSLRREQPDPLERAADDIMRRVGATSTVLRAAASGRLLLLLGETALADAQLREELRAAAAAVADAADALRDPAGGFHAWARADGVVSPLVTADGSARMARGLLHAGFAFDEPRWVEAGSRAADFLVRELRAGIAGLYHAWDGSPGRLGWLEDQTAGVMALLEASEVTGDGEYREQAIELVHAVVDGWGGSDPRAAEYWSLDDAGGPFDEPYRRLSTNVELAEARLWLGRLTHDERYLTAALAGLTAFAPQLEAASEAHGAYARVADRMQSAEPEVAVVASAPVGEPDRAADPLLASALRLRVAARSVQRLTLDRDVDRFDQLALPASPTGVAYVRIGSSLSAPIDDPARLAQAVEDTYLAFIG